MNITNKNKRRKFLKNAGSTALFASLGTSFLVSCSTSEENVDPTLPPDETGGETGVGFTVDGDVYTFDLTHSSFTALKSVGGWKRFDQGGMLLVNVGQNIIRAFNSSCPHGDTQIITLDVAVMVQHLITRVQYLVLREALGI